MKKKKRLLRLLLVILSISALGIILWLLCGVPGGWFPGTYYPQTGYYSFEDWFTGKYRNSTFAKTGYGIVRVWSPLGNPDSIFFYPYETDPNRKRYQHTPYTRDGLIDTTGKVILPLVYDRVSYAGGYNYMVENKGLRGLYNADLRKMILPMEYTSIRKQPTPRSGHYIVRDVEGRFGMTDSREGKILVPCKYDRCSDRDEHAIFGREISENGLYDYDVYDYDGNLIFSGTYETLFTDSPSLPFQARKGRESYFINKETLEARMIDFIPLWNADWNDSMIIACGIYPDSIRESTPLFEMERSSRGFTSPDGIYYPGRWGITDYSGNILLPFEYDSIARVRHFETGLILVVKNGMCGLINQQMEWVVPLDYQKLKVHGYIPLIQIRKVRMPDNPYYVDVNGTVILSGRNQTFHFDDNNLAERYIDFIFWKNGKYYRMEYDKETERFVWHRRD